jgi:NAD(P)-dependent dehydrogenase (short-subunit alcohol dehydrogenase family)
MDLGLAGATVVVNGGSKGMGRAAAESIAAEGARVAVLARGKEALDAMKVIAEDFGHPANLGRAGDPGEIGPVIAFVASRVNSYMTGADINVDGGSDF